MQKTRNLAQKSLLKVLQTVLEEKTHPSEAKIRDMWLFELKKNKEILEEGWYSPPPHGIAVLMGSDNDGENNRINYKSLRPNQKWPRDDVCFDTNNNIIFAYASPIHKQYGIIGDFGITLYFGSNPEIKKHLALSYTIVQKVYEYVKPGFTFSQITRYQKQLIHSNGLNNEIECKTNPSLSDDVGHSIPFIMETPTKNESEIIKSENQKDINKIISEKRIFIRASEDMVIRPGMAFTIEPRPRAINNPKIPMVSFHTICAIREDGRKELFTNFTDLFDFAGMSYLNS
jgi:hypothetical protein